jgi:hypothetical protein
VATDDEEAVGFPFGAVVVTLPTVAPVTQGVQVWGVGGAGGGNGAAEQVVVPWSVPFVRAHYFFAAALLMASPVHLVAIAFADRSAGDALRVQLVQVAAVGQAGAPTSVTVTWRDSVQATPAGAAVPYTALGLTALQPIAIPPSVLGRLKMQVPVLLSYTSSAAGAVLAAVLALDPVTMTWIPPAALSSPTTGWPVVQWSVTAPTGQAPPVHAVAAHPAFPLNAAVAFSPSASTPSSVVASVFEVAGPVAGLLMSPLTQPTSGTVPASAAIGGVVQGVGVAVFGNPGGLAVGTPLCATTRSVYLVPCQDVTGGPPLVQRFPLAAWSQVGVVVGGVNSPPPLPQLRAGAHDASDGSQSGAAALGASVLTASVLVTLR